MADDDARTPVAAAIASAQERLQEALAALACLPLVDTAALRFTQHALANYLTVTSATVDVLLELNKASGIVNCKPDQCVTQTVLA